MINLIKILSFLSVAVLVSDACASGNAGNGYRWVEVSGTGTHFFSTAIIHSQTPTETGYIQRSTDTIELEGDLTGRVLYHPVSVFDFAAGTLVNTGHQVFSGTVLGSEPVLIYDDEFRFDVNLITGETIGKVFLTDPMAGAKTQCELTIVGVATPGEDPTVSYTGRCKVKMQRQAEYGRDDRQGIPEGRNGRCQDSERTGNRRCGDFR